MNGSKLFFGFVSFLCISVPIVFEIGTNLANPGGSLDVGLTIAGVCSFLIGLVLAYFVFFHKEENKNLEGVIEDGEKE